MSCKINNDSYNRDRPLRPSDEIFSEGWRSVSCSTWAWCQGPMWKVQYVLLFLLPPWKSISRKCSSDLVFFFFFFGWLLLASIGLSVRVKMPSWRCFVFFPQSWDSFFPSEFLCQSPKMTERLYWFALCSDYCLESTGVMQFGWLDATASIFRHQVKYCNGGE